MTVLIDTNIILDYVLKREPFAQSALQCLDRLMEAKAKVWLTASTITDIYYVGPDRIALRRGFDAGLMDWDGNWIAKRRIFTGFGDD